MGTTTIEQFLQLEKEVWSALASGDIAADTRLLADDFLGVYSSGFAGKEEHTGQLLALPSPPTNYQRPGCWNYQRTSCFYRIGPTGYGKKAGG